MHMVIRVLVRAEDEDGAVRAAQRVFENNLHYSTGGAFDYCQPMEGGHTVAGSDRWGDYADGPLAFPLDSLRGIEEVEDAWEATKDEMRRDAERVVEGMADIESADELVDTLIENDDLMRHSMHKLGEYCGTTHFLHVENYVTVRDQFDWDHVQDIIEEAKHSDEDEWWVVPLDVHH